MCFGGKQRGTPNALLAGIILWCRKLQLNPLLTSVTEAAAQNLRLIT